MGPSGCISGEECCIKFLTEKFLIPRFLLLIIQAPSLYVTFACFRGTFGANARRQTTPPAVTTRGRSPSSSFSPFSVQPTGSAFYLALASILAAIQYGMIATVLFLVHL